MHRRPARLALTILLAATALTGCANRPRPTESFTNLAYATWQDEEPDYRLFPGDTLDIAAGGVPELNRTVTVQPDGRVVLPMIQPVMAADRSAGELQQVLVEAYASQLVRPSFEVNVKTATPLRVFVGGEVDKPGVYDMGGDIDALQAATMAGGFRTSADLKRVIVIRRGPGGRPMMRTVDLSRTVFDPAHGDTVPLRRFDVIFVPRSGISQAGLFVQQYLRDVLPVQFSYAVNGQYATTR